MIANRISFHFIRCRCSVAARCSSEYGTRCGDRHSECDLAATGACNYLGQEVSSIGFNQLGIISKTGIALFTRTRTIHALRGCLRYLLKMPDAQRDGDKIFAVIRGCGLNTAGAEPEADVLTKAG